MEGQTVQSASLFVACVQGAAHGPEACVALYHLIVITGEAGGINPCPVCVMVPVNGCAGLLGQGRNAGGRGAICKVARVAGVAEDKDNTVMFQHPIFVQRGLCGCL